MNTTTWKRLLSPLASLRLTVTLLVLSILLVFTGTLAQRDLSIWQVQRGYFYSLFCWVPLQNFIFRAPLIHGKPIVVPMPGGYLIGLFLLINLLAAHLMRFKFSMKDLGILPALAIAFAVAFLFENVDIYWTVAVILAACAPLFAWVWYLHDKRTGVILIHLSLILLLAGEGISSVLKTESNMSIDEGQSSSYSFDLQKPELAVAQSGPGASNTVTMVPLSHILASQNHRQAITDSQLPFDLQVDAYYPNSTMLGPFQAQGRTDVIRADAGELKDRVFVDEPRFAGAGEARVDIPSAYVTVIAHGQRLGRYALNAQFPGQTVNVDGKAYELALRFHRYYNPYSLYLEKFTVDRYPGTNSPQGYSAMVRLVDPTRQVDRKIRIWMNHPLRYYGKTFYQAGFNEETEKSTTLQVVTNPGWQIPYVACAIGGLGLVTHFLLKLIEFLRKQAKLSASINPTAPVGRSPEPRSDTRPRRRPTGKPALSLDRAGAISVTILLPVCMLFLSLVLAGALSMPAVRHSNAMGIAAFGDLPIFQGGRLQPYDSFARNSLQIIHGHQMYLKDDKVVTADQWLLDFQDKPEQAVDEKVLAIDFKEISGLITTNADQKYFSLKEILDHWTQLYEPLAALPQELDRNASMYDRKLSDFRDHLFTYFQMNSDRSLHYFGLYPALPVESAKIAQGLGLPPGTTRASLADLFTHSGVLTELQDARRTSGTTPLAEIPQEQRALVKLDRASRALIALLSVSTPLEVVPLNRGDQWMSMQQARAEEQKAKAPLESLSLLEDIHDQYAAGDVAKFNAAVAAYQARVDAAMPSPAFRAQFEAGFNRADPFFTCVWLYVFAFVLVALSWLRISPNWSLGFYWSAICVVAFALLLHTIGLGCRVYISGWGPVTNLASSAIFIAWAIVVMALGFDLYHRNGVFLVAATIAGVASLLIADGLSADGDTLKVLEPVLATQFWLWTHVIGVTLGYAATALAGALAMLYVVLALARRLGKEESRSLIRMIYGVVCFGMLFSFVGTILGGIWADQSWGRFWGWDPKENGAVLVVLSNALLLHARWGGIARARGIVGVALFGAIVVSWSWFGTNMLGIGLHAYGFTDMKRLYFLIGFVAMELLFIAVNYFMPDPSVQSEPPPIAAYPAY